jgi:hypothetical protein
VILDGYAPPFRLHGVELPTSLLAVADRIVGAEWDLLAARQEKLLATFHEVLLIERPRIHEILKHDHDHVPGDLVDGQPIRKLAGLTRNRDLTM